MNIPMDELSLLQTHALEAAANAIVILDREARVVWANAAFSELTGYGLEEVRGENVKFLKSGVQDVSYYKQLWDTVLSGHIWQGELINRKKNGALYIEQQTITPVKNSAGKVTHFISVKVDVTQQKNAEKALRQSEEKFRQMVENIKEVFFITGPGGAPMYYISPSYETIWGCSCDELYAAPGSWMKNILPEDRRGVEEEMKRSNGMDFQAEYRIRRPDGEIRWIRARSFPVTDGSGAAERAVGIAEDITEYKKLQEQFFQAQKMEAVGQLAGGVAHDFNNILTAILGDCAFLLRNVERHDPKTADIEDIQASAIRAAALTQQLLAFSRRQVIQPKILEVNSMLENLQKMLRRLISEDIRLKLELGSGLPVIKADPGKVEQMILNLVVNSRDAMPKGGDILLRTAAIRLDQPQAEKGFTIPAGRYILISVSDTGCGIDPKNQSRVFEPFFTTKGIGKGTGLGLSTVYGIVKQNNGYIGLSSQEGKGTTFNIYFPISVQAEPARTSGAASKSEVQGTETILIVEDEEFVRRVMVRMLKPFGYKILDAGSGMEALEMSRKYSGKLDLLLTDTVMPQINGRELATRLQALRPGLRVLYTSGYTDSAIVQKCVLDPSIQFIQKPFGVEELATKVREVLDSIEMIK